MPRIGMLNNGYCCDGGGCCRTVFSVLYAMTGLPDRMPEHWKEDFGWSESNGRWLCPSCALKDKVERMSPCSNPAEGACVDAERGTT